MSPTELHKQHRNKLEDITHRFESIKLTLSVRTQFFYLISNILQNILQPGFFFPMRFQYSFGNVFVSVMHFRKATIVHWSILVIECFCNYWSLQYSSSNFAAFWDHLYIIRQWGLCEARGHVTLSTSICKALHFRFLEKGSAILCL